MENVPFGIKRLEDIDRFQNKEGIRYLQEIGKRRRVPHEEWDDLKVIAQQMLDLFENIGEIKKYSEGIYRLHEDGLIYQHLAEKLASTP